MWRNLSQTISVIPDFLVPHAGGLYCLTPAGCPSMTKVVSAANSLGV